MTFDERVNFYKKKSAEIGKSVLALCRDAKSFGTFALDCGDSYIMEFIPMFQAGISGAPVNANEDVVSQHHLVEEIDEISDYDFALIFRYEESDYDDIVLEEAKKYGENKYYITIKTNKENIGTMYSCFLSNFMKHNEFIKD